ncbi:MAG: hypothetical protein MHM6MM_006201 [Cercozoa sp. M6MM]
MFESYAHACRATKLFRSKFGEKFGVKSVFVLLPKSITPTKSRAYTGSFDVPRRHVRVLCERLDLPSISQDRTLLDEIGSDWREYIWLNGVMCCLTLTCLILCVASCFKMFGLGDDKVQIVLSKSN